MKVSFRRSPRAAPIWMRAAAGSVDAGLSIAGLGAAHGVRRLVERVRGGSDRPPRDWSWLSSNRAQVAAAVLSLASTVVMRDRRSPGWRLLRIHRVDARSGGPVDVPRAVGLWAANTAVQQAFRLAARPSLRQAREQSKEISAQSQAIHRLHPDDPEARKRALREMARAHRPKSCWWPVVLGAAVQLIPQLLSERNQTLPERIAGVAVVRDR